ncbi:hypothetical protein EDB84DRAFT_1439375 [Lactarius hengduanensis]|nr:hypothetical protein EDB84DRAFT_1439375 [Lactarius hengduanensis]
MESTSQAILSKQRSLILSKQPEGHKRVGPEPELCSCESLADSANGVISPQDAGIAAGAKPVQHKPGELEAGVEWWLGITTGNPRVISRLPVPVPAKTRTRGCGYRFSRVRVRVFAGRTGEARVWRVLAGSTITCTHTSLPLSV